MSETAIYPGFYGQAVYGDSVYGETRIGGSGGGLTISAELWRATIDGQKVEDLSDMLVSGSVDWDYGRAGGLFGSPEGTAMMCTFELRDVARVTPLVDFLMPILNIAYLDGRPPITQQLGLFAVDPPPERHDALTGIATLTGQDLTSVLRDTFFTSTYTVAAGTEFDTQVRTIIQDGGIPVGKHNIRETTKTLGFVRKFTTTSSRLAAANRLLHAIGYYRLFCDLSGWPTSLPYRSWTNTHPAHVFTAADPVDILTVDPQGRPANTVIVHAQRQGRSTLKSVAMNTDNTDPYSVPRLGRQIVYGGGPIVVDDIEDQASLDAYAADLLEEAGSWETIVTLNVLPDPHPDILRTVDLNLGGAKAHLDGRYHLRAWRVGFTPADALHTMRLHRVVKGAQQLMALAS